MRILKVEPGKPAYEKEIENTLESIQKEVEGFFETVYVDNGGILCCNEEGKLNGMEMNRRLEGDIICGPFFIVGEGEEDFVSLTDEQVEIFMKKFGEPQTFRDYEPDAEPRAWIMSF